MQRQGAGCDARLCACTSVSTVLATGRVACLCSREEMVKGLTSRRALKFREKNPMHQHNRSPNPFFKKTCPRTKWKLQYKRQADGCTHAAHTSPHPMVHSAA